jgi:Phosphopantetheine attachment site
MQAMLRLCLRALAQRATYSEQAHSNSRTMCYVQQHASLKRSFHADWCHHYCANNCDYNALPHKHKQVSMPDLLEHATLQSLAALLERRSCNSPPAIHTTDGTTNASRGSSNSRTLSSTEKALAAVWASVLHMDAASAAAVIKRDSDFFDLGGHSLLLVKVAAGVEADIGVQASHSHYIIDS